MENTYICCKCACLSFKITKIVSYIGLNPERRERKKQTYVLKDLFSKKGNETLGIIKYINSYFFEIKYDGFLGGDITFTKFEHSDVSVAFYMLNQI